MPTFRTPTVIVALPGGDFLESGTRVDARPSGRRRGEARRIRLAPRTAGSLA